jgi:hypothetical protein
MKISLDKKDRAAFVRSFVTAVLKCEIYFQNTKMLAQVRQDVTKYPLLACVVQVSPEINTTHQRVCHRCHHMTFI